MAHDPHDHDPAPDTKAQAAFETFIATVVGALVRGVRPPGLFGLADTLVPEVAAAMPPLAAQPIPAQQAAARMLARDIAARTPLPERRFAQRPLPEPGRNEPCDCGSDRKYKQCCQSAPRTRALEGVNLLPWVLDALPRSRWRELAGSAIDPLAVAHAAATWRQAGRLREAEALLEPWFSAGAALTVEHEPLFDLLLDVWLDLGHPRKRKRLIEHALAHGDRGLRSAAHQRLATIAADADDLDTAWRHFRAAQREAPDAPALAHLEVILLLSQGDEARARERARFWAARLQRMDPDGLADLIGLMQQVAREGEAAMTRLPGESDTLLALAHLLDHAPAPALRHRVSGPAAEPVVLVPDRALAGALADWTHSFPSSSPMLTGLSVDDGHPAWDEPQPWLDLLRAQPELWHSFTVIDDLLLALASIHRVGLEPLRQALAGRGEALLRLHAEAAPGREIPWAFHDNRPALRILAQAIAAAPEPPDAAALARMEWMLALNPHDNHGYRSALAAAWLRDGEPARALALIERYPDDSSLGYAHALALLALGREPEARTALADALAALPLLGPALAATRLRKPAMRDGWIQHGGADHAWLHRQALRPAWARYEGALGWLGARLWEGGRPA